MRTFTATVFLGLTTTLFAHGPSDLAGLEEFDGIELIVDEQDGQHHVILDAFKAPEFDQTFERLIGTDTEPGPLKKLKPRRLRLENTKLSSRGLQPLSRLENLRGLQLSGLVMDLEQLKEIVKLTKLTELDLGQGIGDKEIVEILRLTSLEVLDLACTTISDKGLETVVKLKSLKELNLSNQKLSKEGLARLKELPDLQKLTLQSSPISDNALAGLNGLSELKVLDISFSPFDGSGFKDVKLPKLNTLIAYQNHFSDENIAHLANLRSLVVLDLHGKKQKFHLAALLELGALNHLNTIRVGRSRQDDEALRKLEERSPQLSIVFAGQ